MDMNDSDVLRTLEHIRCIIEDNLCSPAALTIGLDVISAMATKGFVDRFPKVDSICRIVDPSTGISILNCVWLSKHKHVVVFINDDSYRSKIYNLKNIDNPRQEL